MDCSINKCKYSNIQHTDDYSTWRNNFKTFPNSEILKHNSNHQCGRVFSVSLSNITHFVPTEYKLHCHCKGPVIKNDSNF